MRNSANLDSLTASISILKNPTKQAIPIMHSTQRFELQVENMKKMMEKDSEIGAEIFGDDLPHPKKKKKRFFFF
jgi:hypothetical protein